MLSRRCLRGVALGFHRLRTLKEHQVSSAEDSSRESYQASISITVLALKACTETKDLTLGKLLHKSATTSGKDTDIYVSCSLINLYAKSRSMSQAKQVFDGISKFNLVALNTLIMGYAENGQPEYALEIFSREVNLADSRTFVAALKACTSLASKETGAAGSGALKLKSLEKGMWIHSLAVTKGCDRSVSFVANSLVDMYANCGSMFDSRMVFDRMESRNVVAWNSLLLGYAEKGEEELALVLFSCMETTEGSCSQDDTSFVAALKACTSLAVKEPGEELNGKVVKLRTLETGTSLHRRALELGYVAGDIYVASTLVDMYSKCGAMSDAQRVFDGMTQHDVVSWTALMLGYAENGEEEHALGIFSYLERRYMANALTFVAGLKACIGLAEKEDHREVDGSLLRLQSLYKGSELHLKARESHCDSDTMVSNTLIDMYCTCGSLVDARRVFESMSERTPVSWNILLLGYVDNGEVETTLELFSRLRGETRPPEARSFVAALKACTLLATRAEGEAGRLEALDKGMSLHVEAARCGLERDIFVASSLVDMYSRCGDLVDARRAFDRMASRDVVLWTSLLLGYVENDEAELTLELFSCMKADGCVPNTRTFTAALKACSSLAAQETGRDMVKAGAALTGMKLHSEAEKYGIDSDTYVGNILVEMYGSCGCVSDSRRVFDRMVKRDMVSWTSLISAYANNGEGSLGLELFSALQGESYYVPNARVFVAVLKACTNLLVVTPVRELHSLVLRYGLFESEPVLVNSLVDVYGRCGSITIAEHVFNSMISCRRSVVSWNALMTGLSRQGNFDMVLEVFRGMVEEGVEPDGVTFICMLSSCSHGGLVEEGMRYFQVMKTRGVKAKLEHYHCVVDILGRSNRVEEAIKLIEEMPYEASSVTWMTALAACQKWKKVEAGRLAFERVIRMDEKDDSAYLLMMNIFASAGMWKEVAEVENMRLAAQTRGKPRLCW